MTEETTKEVDDLLTNWRNRMHSQGLWDGAELLELESHLLDQIGDLVSSGLATEEAFLVATRRLGSEADLQREFDKAGGLSRWRSRLLWMSVGSISLLLFVALKSALIAPLLVLAHTRGLGGLGCLGTCGFRCAVRQ